MDLKKNTYALGLYSYIENTPEAKDYHSYFDLFNKLLSDMDLSTTYYGIDGDGYPDKYIRSGNKRHLDKLKKNNFEGITGFELLVNPSDSDSPSYDHFFLASVDYTERNKELTITIVVNECFISSFDYIEDLVIKLNQIIKIDYGYCSIVDKDTAPEIPICGAENQYMTYGEKMALYNWYDADSVRKKNFIRYIYQYNFLNPSQLERNLQKNQTVWGYFNEHFNKTDFYKVDNINLHCLKVKSSNIDILAEDLSLALV